MKEAFAELSRFEASVGTFNSFEMVFTALTQSLTDHSRTHSLLTHSRTQLGVYASQGGHDKGAHQSHDQ